MKPRKDELSGDMIKMDQFKRKMLKNAGLSERFLDGMEERDRALENIPDFNGLCERSLEKIAEQLAKQSKDEMKSGSPVSGWYERVVQYIRSYF